MKIYKEQIKAVLNLSGPERYKHFIKVISDWEEVWGLFNDGWAMASTDDGQRVFPLWPAKEYAELCATRKWDNYKPESFDLDDLINELLPKLKADGIFPSIFYTPKDKGVVVDVDKLELDLNNEIKKYE